MWLMPVVVGRRLMKMVRQTLSNVVIQSVSSTTFAPGPPMIALRSNNKQPIGASRSPKVPCLGYERRENLRLYPGISYLASRCHIAIGLQERNASAVCVAAPLIANGRFLGMILADNAFNSEPVRPEASGETGRALDDAAILWERGDARRRDLTSAEREQLARLRDQSLREIQREDLRGGTGSHLPRRTRDAQGGQCGDLPVGCGWRYLSGREDRGRWD